MYNIKLLQFTFLPQSLIIFAAIADGGGLHQPEAGAIGYIFVRWEWWELGRDGYGWDWELGSAVGQNGRGQQAAANRRRQQQVTHHKHMSERAMGNGRRLHSFLLLILRRPIPFMSGGERRKTGPVGPAPNRGKEEKGSTNVRPHTIEAVKGNRLDRKAGPPIRPPLWGCWWTDSMWGLWAGDPQTIPHHHPSLFLSFPFYSQVPNSRTVCVRSANCLRGNFKNALGVSLSSMRKCVHLPPPPIPYERCILPEAICHFLIPGFIMF